MNSRAKFVVNSVTSYKGQEKIEATPVIGGSEENKSFSKWTPSGKLELMVTDETGMYQQIKPGDEIYLDITLIETTKPI